MAITGTHDPRLMHLTDSEAATLRAACEIAVDFWTKAAEDTGEAGSAHHGLCVEQAAAHERLRERICNQYGV